MSVVEGKHFGANYKEFHDLKTYWTVRLLSAYLELFDSSNPFFWLLNPQFSFKINS